VLLDDRATEDFVGADAAVVTELRRGEAVSGQPSGLMPSKNVYSCSMPNQYSWLSSFFAVAASALRVFEGCGERSVSRTSHMTRMSSPPRTGSGTLHTGCNTQSDAWPTAWLVEEPSKPQIGIFVASSFMILVFERSNGVGLPPSIQMYSAW